MIRSQSAKRPLLRCGAVAAAMLALTGCSSVVGEWSLARVTPTAAQRDFQYQALTLQKNGSFYAEANEGTVKTVSGTYTFDRKADTLSLKEHDGEQNTYDAQLKKGGKELQLIAFWEGRKVQAVLERVN